MHRDVPEFKRCWTDSGTIVMKKKHIQQLSMLRSYKDLRNWPWIGKSHDTCHLLLPVLETCWNKCFLHQRFPVTSLRFHWTYTLHIPISDCPSYFGNCCARKFINLWFKRSLSYPSTGALTEGLHFKIYFGLQ